ncbi:uncharacterized protein FSUBG_4877 [Fusarium subglutinans]|uniref:Uncharacterized protein n=1 Tax=Gibberella subglutinans TaxID=42677 RepID=A0A8H5Q4J8_GIBSU|nr:uncharacterized protein FSUBG_4877 [Fusarium subglutinans]KAF5608053.1 hypothetical protein FSUBG_4877 [Fusarium subglutinans]
MARNRPSARTRRSRRRRREKLQKASANEGNEQAETISQAVTPEAASPTAQATVDAPASGEKGKPCVTKVRRCRHRHLPDRHYYHREDKYDRRFYALDRRVNERVDDNVAKGRAAINEDYQRHSDNLRRAEGKLAKKVEQIQHAYERDVREKDRKFAGLKRKVDQIQAENEDLREEIANERRRTQRMMLELYESSDSQDTDHSD